MGVSLWEEMTLLQVRQVRKAHRDPQARKAHRGRQVHKAHRGQQAPKEIPGIQGQ